MTEWHRTPNWWLYYRDFLIACWYSQTKAQAKAVAKVYVDVAKSRNKLKPKKLRIYKKDFNLKPQGKGENDA